ncbi:MAG: CvpA family protein, partial [Gammaproteobacteria bacterium]|nr:CvpA family protein [Gammaproteobacteria bacterium]
MTLIDYFIIAILLISAGLGFMRGFFREITLLLSWIISLWLATHFAYLIEPLLAPWVVNEKIRK